MRLSLEYWDNYICYLKLLTITLKSRRYVSLSLLESFHPPNKTAWVGLILVSVKFDLGEGLVPVIDGEDHVPNIRYESIFNC